MNEDLRRYARIGWVHHLLYPRCLEDPDEHARTLTEFVARPDMDTFDCCLPRGAGRRAQLISRVKACGKSGLAFATHCFPYKKLSLTAIGPHEQARVRMIVSDMIEQASAMGATGFVFASGGPPPKQATRRHWAAFAEFCRWLCGELKPRGITALLEPFDTGIDKCFLYGSTAECVALIEALLPETDNLKIELDLAHLPLMGETLEQAIRTVAPHLMRVHLGNCVLRNRTHPRYGDTHPPIGCPGGEIDVPELTIALELLLDVGFLNPDQPGHLILEMTPWENKTVEETIAEGMVHLLRAWRAAVPPETKNHSIKIKSHNGVKREK